MVYKSLNFPSLGTCYSLGNLRIVMYSYGMSQLLCNKTKTLASLLENWGVLDHVTNISNRAIGRLTVLYSFRWCLMLRSFNSRSHWYWQYFTTLFLHMTTVSPMKTCAVYSRCKTQQSDLYSALKDSFREAAGLLPLKPCTSFDVLNESLGNVYEPDYLFRGFLSGMRLSNLGPPCRPHFPRVTLELGKIFPYCIQQYF